MPTISVNLAGDNAWPDLRESPGDVIHLAEETVLQLAALRGGMSSGRTSLALRIDLLDGRVVVVETSLAAFDAAHAALRGAFPEETT